MDLLKNSPESNRLLRKKTSKSDVPVCVSSFPLVRLESSYRIYRISFFWELKLVVQDRIYGMLGHVVHRIE